MKKHKLNIAGALFCLALIIMSIQTENDYMIVIIGFLSIFLIGLVVVLTKNIKNND